MDGFETMVDKAARKTWSTPSLEQLTINLDAIANSGKKTSDNKGGGLSVS